MNARESRVEFEQRPVQEETEVERDEAREEELSAEAEAREAEVIFLVTGSFRDKADLRFTE